MASSSESTHREHGFTPSAKPMTTVATSRDEDDRSTLPTHGMSTLGLVASGVTATLAASASAASASGTSARRVPSSTAAVISAAIASLKPIHTRSPMMVTGTPDGSKPMRAPVSSRSARFPASYQTSWSTMASPGYS